MLIQTLNANPHRFNITLKTGNNHYTNSFRQGKLTADKFQYKTKISFNKSEGPSQETLDYISSIKTDLESRGHKLKSLRQLDLSKIEDIAQGIDIFKGWTSYDLFLLSSNFDSILLQRGCAHQCAHCAAESIPKIINMKWDNFQAIAEGIGKLNKRLGFNILHIGFKDYVYPFQDSDPMIFRSQTTDTKTKQIVQKDIYDAAETFYQNTASKFMITTAGWNNNISQNAAQKIVKDSSMIEGVGYSVTTFHNLLELSREYKRKARAKFNSDSSKELLIQSEKMKNRYINMVANNLITLWPLKDNDKLAISLIYDDNYIVEYGFDDGIELIKDIYKEMQNLMATKNIAKGPKSLSELRDFLELRPITYAGRAINLANSYYKTEATKEETKRKSYYKTVIKEQNYKEIPGSPTYIDTNGEILVNLLPSNNRRIGTTRFYPARISNKKLNLPVKEPEHKIYQAIDKLEWPPISYLKELYKER